MMRFVRWYYGSANLRKKLIISYGLLALLPVLLLGLYSYYFFGESFLEQAQFSMEDAASSMKIGLENSIGRENDNLRYLTYNAQFRNDLENLKKNLNAFTKTLSSDVEPVFWYFITSDENLEWIRIYSPYLHRSIGDFCHLPIEVEDKDWYEESKTNFKTIWRIEDQKIYASRTLLDGESSSRAIGVIEMELDLEKMTEPIRHIDGKEGGTLLLDEKGKIVFKTIYPNKALGEEVEEFILSKKPDSFMETDNFLVAAGQELSNGWKLYYFRDRSVVDMQLTDLKRTTFLLMAISFGFLMILATLVSTLLSERILRLKEAAEEVSRGNFHVTMDLRYDDEIGVVNRSFARMQKKMNDMMEETYKLGMEKRKMELTALQAKINPHFLYNCLSSIKWKAIRKGDDEIADITGLLAKFYRSTLNGGKAITNVGNELETIISYLELQKNTHDNNFDVVLELEEEGRELLMPNFLLQPLVENAIVHGIDSLDDEVRGKIVVTYGLEEDAIVFKIKNNGILLDKDELLRSLRKPGGGYGMYNIRERIRLYYNDPKYGITANVEEDGMVCFTVKLGRQLKSVDLEQDSLLINR